MAPTDFTECHNYSRLRAAEVHELIPVGSAYPQKFKKTGLPLRVYNWPIARIHMGISRQGKL